MTKVVYISERNEKNLFQKFLEMIFDSDKIVILQGSEVWNLLIRESPKLLFFDFRKSSDRDIDISEYLQRNDYINIYKISIINIGLSNIPIYRAIQTKMANIFKNRLRIWNKGSQIKEAF
jgi:hypothetical protein